MQICNELIEGTALAVYWVTDGVGRCQDGFSSWHLVKQGDKFDGAQVMKIYNADDMSKQKRQKVYKNFGFAKAVFISEVGIATKDS